MPKGPQGQKRPADAIGLAVMVGRIATGEIEDRRDDPEAKKAAKVAAGRKGGNKRAAATPAARRTEIAKKAARARWPESADE
jgi:hypothetical protein